MANITLLVVSFYYMGSIILIQHAQFGNKSFASKVPYMVIDTFLCFALF